MATVIGARSGIGKNVEITYVGNKIDAGSDLGGDVGDNGLAIMSSGNRTNARSDLGKNVGDDRSAVIGTKNRINTRSGLEENTRNNKLVVVNNRLATRDNESAAGDD